MQSRLDIQPRQVQPHLQEQQLHFDSAPGLEAASSQVQQQQDCDIVFTSFPNTVILIYSYLCISHTKKIQPFLYLVEKFKSTGWQQAKLEKKPMQQALILTSATS